MRWLRTLKLWMVENRLHKWGYRRLQAHQIEESRELVDDIRERRREMTHELADVLLRLDAVSDRLEQSLEDLQERTE